VEFEERCLWRGRVMVRSRVMCFVTGDWCVRDSLGFL
jgi:hypothetical protein